VQAAHGRLDRLLAPQRTHNANDNCFVAGYMSAAQWEIVSPASAMPSVEKAAGALIVSVSYAKKRSLGAAVECRACSKIGGSRYEPRCCFSCCRVCLHFQRLRC
jgi:hypothetical protein